MKLVKAIVEIVKDGLLLEIEEFKNPDLDEITASTNRTVTVRGTNGKEYVITVAEK